MEIENSSPKEELKNPELDLSKIKVGDFVHYIEWRGSICIVSTVTKDTIGFDIYNPNTLGKERTNIVYSKTSLKGKLFFEENTEILDKFKIHEDIRKTIFEYKNKLESSYKTYKDELATYIGKTLIEKFDSVLKHHFAPTHYQIEVVDSAARIILKFDDITIENSSGEKNLIKSMFVRMDYGLVENRFLSGIRGAAGEMTVKNVMHSYIHSHLPSGSTAFGSSFCLGISELQDILYDMSAKPYDADKFDLFLYNLKEYVKWESTEGGPHIRMNTLKYSDSSNRVLTPNDNGCELVFTQFLKKKSNFNTVFNFSTNQIDVVDDELLKASIFSICPDPYKCYNVNGTLSSTIGYKDLIERAKIKLSGFSKHTFQGERYPKLFVEEALTKDESEAQLEPHPQLIKYVKEKLEKNINTHFLNTLK